MLASIQSLLSQKLLVLGSTSKGRQQLFKQLGCPVSLAASNFPENLDKDMHPIDYVMKTAEGKILSIFFDMVQQQSSSFNFPDCIIAADTMVTMNFENYDKRHDTIWNQANQAESYVIIGKPENDQDAIDTLTKLSGHTHSISTGVCIMMPFVYHGDNDNNPLEALTALITSIFSSYDQSTLYDTSNPNYIHQNGLLPTFKVSCVDSSTPTSFSTCSHHGDWYLIQFSATTSVIFDTIDQATIASYVSTGEPIGKAGSYAIQGIGGSLVKSINGCYQNIVGFPTNKFGHFLLHLIQHIDSGFEWA